MKRRVLILVGTLLVLGIFAKGGDQDNLRSEVERWRNFRAEGVVQVNYGQLALRNMFVMVKNGSELRLDLMGGGAWGSGGGAIFSAYFGEYFSIQSPMMPNLQGLDFDSFLPGDQMNLIPDLDVLWQMYGDEILSKRTAVVDSVEIQFNKDMQLERIYDPRSNGELTIRYNRRRDPDNVTVKMEGKTVAVFEIDEIKYGEFPVEPLPPMFKLPSYLPEIGQEQYPQVPDAE